MEVAWALSDLAIAQRAEHARVAYRRAARAVLMLPQGVDRLVEAGTLREVRHIGPSSEGIVNEVLAHGTSPRVARAIEASDRGAAVESMRRFRAGFISRAQAEEVLATPAPRGVVGRDDYRGDLQMHTRWSDGGETIAAMVRAGRARGYDYIGVTDHSYGLPIAGGMSMAEVIRQHREIDRLNARLGRAGHVFKGIEANLRADGSADMTADELRAFDYVAVAPHSLLRRAIDQTPRMLAAVRQAGVHVLAHPRGRMFTRQGVLADWDQVFEAAAASGVAVELDGDPWRQDLDHALARRALAAGCLFALDSDAHAGAELAYTEWAIAHARLAGIPARRVINTWPREELAEWFASRRAGARPARRPRASGARRRRDA